VRRLHDIDRSGWWYLLGFVPLIDSIALSAGNVPGMFNTYSPSPDPLWARSALRRDRLDVSLSAWVCGNARET
jgi:hypothetical protein